MSKMDNLRAMREAKYAETLKRSAAAAKSAGSKASGSKASGAKAKDAAPPSPGAGPAAPPSDSADGAEPALCGHRNMSGRSCTREHGHAARSHRYS